MRRAMLVALGTGAVISSAAALAISAAGGDAQSRSLDRTKYEAAIRAVEAARAANLSRCEALAGHERDYCRVEAAAAEMIEVAEIEAAYQRTERFARALQKARIDARYQLDRARCAPLSGFQRDKCLIRAHAAKGRHLLDAAAPYEVRF